METIFALPRDTSTSAGLHQLWGVGKLPLLCTFGDPSEMFIYCPQADFVFFHLPVLFLH